MRRVMPCAAALVLIAAVPVQVFAQSPVQPPSQSAGMAPGHVPEPAGLWRGPMHGYTPNTLAGATVIDTAAFASLLRDKHSVIVDVAEADRKPATMPKTTLWMPAHRSIPGAVWLPGAGSGSDDPSFSDTFRTRFADLSGGDNARPIVAFCHPECWGSWNAAKRLVGLGYTHVYWYPDGMEGWQAMHETTFVKADSRWALPVHKDATQ